MAGMPFVSLATSVAHDNVDNHDELIAEQTQTIITLEERLAKLEAQLLALGGQ